MSAKLEFWPGCLEGTLAEEMFGLWPLAIAFVALPMSSHSSPFWEQWFEPCFQYV